MKGCVVKDLPAMEMPKSSTSVGKKTCKMEAKIKIHRAEKRPAPHELNSVFSRLDYRRMTNL